MKMRLSKKKRTRALKAQDTKGIDARPFCRLAVGSKYGRFREVLGELRGRE
jgi:hypothetical protein